ncbi:MAG TPA: SprT family zinc-dependent metalloprotease [Ktedonobacterales bacterium]|nr:SprT family zinc-dependent metalloprotease [Ktedonobacterales bacterium]
MTRDKTRPHADQTLPPRCMPSIIDTGDHLFSSKAAPRRPTPQPVSARPGPALREQRSIRLSQGPQEYTLRRSARARRVRLVVQPGGALEVVAPQSATLTRVETALREHETWIIRTRARLAATTPSPELEPLTDGRALPCAGRELRLSLRVGAPTGRIQTRVEDDQLTLTLPRDDETLARGALERWYRRHAQTVFAERLTYWNAYYGYTWTRVAIKEQKTRWGSCSRLGALNFNWRLMLAPLPVLDYVVIHELCHLKEPNHGPRFWALVARACPDHRERRDWLRQHGHELRL